MEESGRSGAREDFPLTGPPCNDLPPKLGDAFGESVHRLGSLSSVSRPPVAGIDADDGICLVRGGALGPADDPCPLGGDRRGLLECHGHPK